MAIQQGIWKMGITPQKLRTVPLDNENLLEEQVCHDISILSSDWLLIGRQVRTAFDKLIDLLALDANGSVIIIELKRDKTPREVVAQTIDYASWVVTLKPEQLVEIYQDFILKHPVHDNGVERLSSLDQAFQNKFGLLLSDVALNESHQMVVVATALDASTERIINYLNDYANLPINAVFFAAFADGENHYLSRAWMIDPDETQERAVSQGAKEAWNGEFYISFGHDGDDRHWSDAVQYGFIAGGGGHWYSKTLDKLNEGDRVWVNIPKTGYVGVGIVAGEKCRLEQYAFADHKGQTLLELQTEGDYSLLSKRDEDTAEYLVPVKWAYTVKCDNAFSETGLFGNQNTVCAPRTPKWRHTVDRLKQVWQIE
ncbi:hypothetical protein [uncultured Endozoicomonas sp.]|uniref:hypothetical protein n=1 Tax=uncultured Endozoicomonas sp. TaxID=432652 RepID=UPI0026060E9E|nr:hypothetical protein [uncultured Endozoicomonas sp.]